MFKTYVLEWSCLVQVKKLEQEKDTLLASNKSIAEYNLTLEPRLIQSRQQLAETYEQAVQIQKGFERNKLKLGLFEDLVL